jgi:hypothetical protein
MASHKLGHDVGWYVSISELSILSPIQTFQQNLRNSFWDRRKRPFIVLYKLNFSMDH